MKKWLISIPLSADAIYKIDAETKEDDYKAIIAAWKVLKPQLDSSDWTAAESGNYYGFFAWGWEARRQYDTPPVQEVEPVAKVLREALAWAMVYGPFIPGNQWDEMREAKVAEFGARITPADDGLREAAEKAYAMLLELGYSVTSITPAGEAVISNLRAELDKGKS